jgi:hypothetical protein
VPYAVVQAVPSRTLSGAVAGPGGPGATSGAEVTADASGRFVELRVDADAMGAAVYDLIITPPAGSAEPKAWLDGFSVSQDMDVTVRLPMGFLRSGTVLEAGGALLGDVQVRVYEVVTREATGEAIALLRAEAQTDPDGRFEVVLTEHPAAREQSRRPEAAALFPAVVVTHQRP